jgi:hypothetical protein
MEVCPQFNDSTNFVGAATIAQVKLFNMDPGRGTEGRAVLKEECGFAQNCCARWRRAMWGRRAGVRLNRAELRASRRVECSCPKQAAAAECR